MGAGGGGAGWGGRVRQQALEVGDSSGDAGFHGSQGNAEDLRDFGVRVVFQVKEGDGGTEGGLEPAESGQGQGTIGPLQGIRGDFGEFGFGGFDRFVGKAEGAAGFGGRFAVERGEEPGFDAGDVGELVAALGPAEERFLDEVAGIGFVAGETAGEAIERFQVLAHQVFEVHVAAHAEVTNGSRQGVDWFPAE